MLLVVPKRSAVSDFLPTHKCVEIDSAYMPSNDTSSRSLQNEFAKHQYLQPALQNPRIYPDISEEYEDDDEASARGKWVGPIDTPLTMKRYEIEDTE